MVPLLQIDVVRARSVVVWRPEQLLLVAKFTYSAISKDVMIGRDGIVVGAGLRAVHNASFDKIAVGYPAVKIGCGQR
jgi:hypothetical protein